MEEPMVTVHCTKCDSDKELKITGGGEWNINFAKGSEFVHKCGMVLKTEDIGKDLPEKK